MNLIKPTKKYESSWRMALVEFETEKQGGFWNIPEKPTNLDDYIELVEDHSRGKSLPTYWVPSTTYWLIDNGEFIGHVNIRHKLNDKLKKIGGNIGYAIRSQFRNQGYGAKILELAIPKARELGLEKALVTCDDDNVASAKIIEKNGGRLESTLEFEGKLIRHYWLDVLPKN